MTSPQAHILHRKPTPYESSVCATVSGSVTGCRRQACHVPCWLSTIHMQEMASCVLCVALISGGNLKPTTSLCCCFQANPRDIHRPTSVHISRERREAGKRGVANIHG